ncbi:MAG TPA: TlpA family protein disulfide reductase [Spirochaetes bacterium]|nr:TlpA family protein disulfide reductase [Spirochaetota bacterium]
MMNKIIRDIFILFFLVLSATAAVVHADDGTVFRGNGKEDTLREDTFLVKNIDYFAELGIAKPMTGLAAINFSAESLDGKMVNLFDFKGKVIFLNFWATWCDPCKAEVKDIDKLWGMLKDEDFVVMAVDLREKKKKVRTFIEEYGIDFPVYLDPSGRISSMYSVGGIPTTYIIDPDGNVVGKAIGPRDWGGKESIGFMRSLMRPKDKT